jgi:hypothetical protein
VQEQSLSRSTLAVMTLVQYSNVIWGWHCQVLKAEFVCLRCALLYLQL